MKGKVLGFDATSGAGAINGETGERFTFVAAQWRSDKPIAAGAAVDFAPLAGVATEIYPVVGGMAGGPDLSEIASSPAVQKVRTLGLTTLAFPLAILLLIATLLPALSSPMQSVSLWGLGAMDKMISANPLLSDDGSFATDQLARLDQEEKELREALAARNIPVPSDAEIAAAKTGTISLATGEATLPSRFKELQERRAQFGQQLSDQSWRSMLSSALILRWLVPSGALGLAWLAWSGKVTTKPSIALGSISLFIALLVYLYRGALIGHPKEGSIGAAISQQMDAAISVGFGTWLIGLIGIGLVLGGLGILRNPLAAKA